MRIDLEFLVHSLMLAPRALVAAVPILPLQFRRPSAMEFPYCHSLWFCLVHFPIGVLVLLSIERNRGNIESEPIH